MVIISKIYFCLLVVFVIQCANGLRCYYCTASSSIYNKSCQYPVGTNALPSRECPSGFTSCFARYAEDADGNFYISRDCTFWLEEPSWNYPLEITLYCAWDGCNSGILESVLATTVSSSFSSTEPITEEGTESTTVSSSFSSTEPITEEGTESTTEPNSSANGIPDMKSIWILAFATILCYI